MLQNENTGLIYYESLKDTEKSLLRKSCTRYIKSEPVPGIFDQFYEMFCTCSIKTNKKDLSNSLIDLMDYFINEKDVTDITESDILVKDIEIIAKSINMEMQLDFSNIDNKILFNSFFLYLKNYFNYFLDDEIMILLLLSETNLEKRNEFLKRIPFIISSHYRLFFIKLKNLKNNKNIDLINIAKLIIKCKRRELEINENVQHKLLNDLLNNEFMEFEEEFFNI